MFGDLSIIGIFMASPTMVVLALCSIVTVGFTVERLLYFKGTQHDTRRFMTELTNKLKGGDARGALEYCQRDKSPVGRIMAQGLTHFNRSREELAQRLDTAIDLETVEMERNLGVLGTMSNIAPLLGLFGTVVGIIRAFADIARTGSGGGAVVAMGVSEALMTTAAGIVVAVIATVFFNFFVRRIRCRTAHLEDARESFFSIWGQVQQKRQTARPATPAARERRPAAEPVAQEQEEPLAAVLS
ncbi:MAG: MotA/TolQ/ExbB proton channel family protein [bacterium]|nr:MotA/TolQ/ExbB proton channel family protein [bacterium]